MLGQLDNNMKRIKLDPCLTPYTNTKWINIRAKAIKLLEGSIGINLPDLRLGNRFLDLIPKTQATKEKTDKSD